MGGFCCFRGFLMYLSRGAGCLQLFPSLSYLTIKVFGLRDIQIRRPCALLIVLVLFVSCLMVYGVMTPSFVDVGKCSPLPSLYSAPDAGEDREGGS